MVPIRLIDMTIIKRAPKIEGNPFRCPPNVRLVCSAITEERVFVTAERRLGLIQNVGCRMASIENLISQNATEEREKRELVAGSNEEKISTIIKL